MIARTLLLASLAAFVGILALAWYVNNPRLPDASRLPAGRWFVDGESTTKGERWRETGTGRYEWRKRQ